MEFTKTTLRGEKKINKCNLSCLKCGIILGVAIVIQYSLVRVLGYLARHFLLTDDYIFQLIAYDHFVPPTSKQEFGAAILVYLRDGHFLGLLGSLIWTWWIFKNGISGIKKVFFLILPLINGLGIWFWHSWKHSYLISHKSIPEFVIHLGWFAILLECIPLWFLLWFLWSNRSNKGNKRVRKGYRYSEVGHFVRGARLVAKNSSENAIEDLTYDEFSEGSPAGISIWADKPFPYKRENQHFLIVGSPGSGKTQIIYPMIEQVFKRGDKAIIWDVKGTFTQAFSGEEGVDLLAAWDKRSIEWSPGLDIRNHLDCQQVASIMFPHNLKDSQPFFLNSARQILEVILMYLDSQGNNWGWGEVWSIISKDRHEIASLLSTFDDGKALSKIIGADTKSSEDIYSTLISHAQQIIRWYAKAWPNGKDSLRKWVHSNSKLLIIGGIPERVELAQATANITIEIIVNEILSLPDDPNRRIWLFLDELATLGKLEALLKAFSLGRSKGLCVVAGIQDIGKIEHHYGNMLAKSIANTFSTMIFLRCSDVDTSKWASAVLGEQDVLEIQKSSGKSSQGFWQPTTFTESEHKHLRTRALFTPTEISHFENLSGVIRISGWPLLNVQWQYKAIPQKNKLIDEADWLMRKNNSFEKSKEPPNEPLEEPQWRLDP